MMKVQTLNTQLGGQPRQRRGQLIMGNRSVELALLTAPCKAHAVLIPWLKQPNHPIKFIADQGGQIINVLLYSTTISMRNEQPPRTGSLTQPI